MNHLGLGACLADDMGLGKTIQVLSLLLALRRGRATAKTDADCQAELADCARLAHRQLES